MFNKEQNAIFNNLIHRFNPVLAKTENDQTLYKNIINKLYEAKKNDDANFINKVANEYEIYSNLLEDTDEIENYDDTDKSTENIEQLRCNLIDAIENEINYIRNDAIKNNIPSEIRFAGANLHEELLDSYIYELSIKELDDIEEHIPDGIDVFYEDEKIFGKVEQCFKQENKIYVEFKVPIQNIEGKLLIDLTSLLRNLKDKLTLLKEGIFNEQLLTYFFSYNYHKNDKEYFEVKEFELTKTHNLNIYQESAIKRGLASRFIFLWGPPGTGKTHTIGVLIDELVSKGEKVLVLSHTNVAVDTALSKIYNSNYKVYRNGYPTKYLANNKIYNKNSYVIERFKKEGLLEDVISFCRSMSTIVKVKVNENYLIPTLNNILNKLSDISGYDRELKIVKEYIRHTKEYLNKLMDYFDVIGSTLTKCYITNEINLNNITYIIIDEISTVNIALIFYLLSQCNDNIRFFFAGDFNQLPPIAKCKRYIAKKFLGTDIYSYLSLDQTNNIVSDEMLFRPILRIQYRMHPDICCIINKLYYSGGLITSDEILNTVQIEKDSLLQGPILILDTIHHPESRSEKDKNDSRYNKYHVKLIGRIFEIMLNGTSKNLDDSTSVITPYRKQRLYLKEALKEKIDKKVFASNLIRINTIHSFQGQEEDNIIIDLVDAPNEPPGFLKDKNKIIKKLLNVAISRARNKLILVINSLFFENPNECSSIYYLLKLLKLWGNYIQVNTLPDEELEIRINKFLTSTIKTTKRNYSIKEHCSIVQKFKTLYYGKHSCIKISDVSNVGLIQIALDKDILEVPAYELEAVKKDGIWSKLIDTKESFIIGAQLINIRDYI